MNAFLSGGAVKSAHSRGMPMAVRRKVFRIEESVRPHASRNGATGEVDGVVNRSELLAELAALRALIASPSSPDGGAAGTRAQIDQARAYRQELSSIFAAVEAARGDMEALKADARSGERTARASRELAAIVGGTEKATQDVLQAAEKIDQAAAILAAAVKNPQDLGLTRDIQDYVVQIYEACNFQDLTGQHVGHVVAALKFVEERLIRKPHMEEVRARRPSRHYTRRLG